MHLYQLVYILLISNSAFAAGTFTYRLEYLDSNTPRSTCTEKIKAVAADLEAKTNVHIKSTLCAVDEFDHERLNGIIKYDTDAKIEMCNARTFLSESIDTNGVYKSLQECLEATLEQERIYSEATGLPVFYSYCYPVSSIEPRMYSLQIEALGSCNVRHYSASTSVYGTIAEDRDAFLSGIKARLEENGLIVSDINVYQSQMWNRLRAAYYANERLVMYVNSEVRYDNLARCKADLAATKELFLGADRRVLSAYCDSQNGLSGTRLNILELSKSTVQGDVYSYYQLPGYYPNVPACEKALPAQKAQLVAQGLNVLGLYCGYNQESRLVMHAFVN